MERMKEQSTSVKATQEINKIIDEYNVLEQENNTNNITAGEFINKFNDINREYNTARKEISKSLVDEKASWLEKIKNYFTKSEDDARYLNSSNKDNFISKATDWILNHTLTMNNAVINAHKSDNTLMTINGVKIIMDGDWLKMINPDGSELFAKNINDGTERALNRDLFKLIERKYIPATWNIIENSRVDNVGGTITLPSGWNDLIVIVDNTTSDFTYWDKQNEHKLAPSYVYMCSAEVPIKFFTPYATAGLEVTKTYVMLTAKTGWVGEDYNGNKSRDFGKILKVLWR